MLSLEGWLKIVVIKTPWSQVLLEKPPVAQLLKNFPIFYGTRRFITVTGRGHMVFLKI
jgi:hypothetical protein